MRDSNDKKQINKDNGQNDEDNIFFYFGEARFTKITEMVGFWNRYRLDINYNGLVAANFSFRDYDGYCEWIKDCMGFFEATIWIIEGTNKMSVLLLYFKLLN